MNELEAAGLTIIQYIKENDAYRMRIGESIIDLPSSLTDQIGSALETIEPFNTCHAMIAHDIWNGQMEFEPDIMEIGDQ